MIAVTGGYIGDAPPYQGHVAVLDAENGALLRVWNSLCSDRSGTAADGSVVVCRERVRDLGTGRCRDRLTTGRIFVATGNGRWDGQTYWGDATLVLDADAGHLIENQTPTNTDALNANDLDVGSTSPVLLGGEYIAQGGKDGKIRLLDLSQMRGSAPHRGGEVQTVSTPSGAGLFSAPAVLRTDSATWVFVADRGGTAAWMFRARRLQSVWSNQNPGTSPVVAGGVLYVYDPAGRLRVYDPQTGRMIAGLPCGGGHWNSPIVVDGRILLPEGNANNHEQRGVLDIWRAAVAR